MATSLKQSIVIILIIGVSSFYAGRLSAPVQTQEITKEVTKEIIKEKIIPDPQSEEYYEKAFNLFLATIGVRLSRNQEALAQELFENPKEFSSRDLRPNQYQEEVPSPVAPRNTLPTPAPTKKEAPQTHPAQDVLDPLTTIKNASLIKDFRTLKRFNGEYRGIIRMLQGNQKGEDHDVYLGLDYIRDGKEIRGEFRAEIARNGEVYSNSSGSGQNNQIRLSGNDLIIEVSPDSFFFFKDKRITKGTFYSRGEFKGIIKLSRLN